MLTRSIGVGSIMILCLSAVALSDGTFQPPPTPQSENDIVSAPLGGVQGEEAMRAATAVLFISRNERLAELQARHDACGDPLERIAFQREVQRIKRETELEWLDLQLRWARSAGRERDAAFIEEAIEVMTTDDTEGRDAAPEGGDAP